MFVRPRCGPKVQLREIILLLFQQMSETSADGRELFLNVNLKPLSGASNGRGYKERASR